MHGVLKMKRKIIQITNNIKFFDKKKEILSETIKALCKDNSLWQLQIDHRLIYGTCEIKHWKKLPDIPQAKNDN